MRPPWLGVAALPGGDDAPGTLDDRDQWQDVVSLQARLDDEVDLAEREQAVIVAIAAEAPETHRRCQSGKALVLLLAVVNRSGLDGGK